MKRNPSKHRSKANPSSGSSIEKELMAAFAWAKIDSEERKDFKGKDLDALFAHARKNIRSTIRTSVPKTCLRKRPRSGLKI
jgi:hypothetical protein